MLFRNVPGSHEEQPAAPGEEYLLLLLLGRVSYKNGNIVLSDP